jgi:hypothetical protein
MREGAAFEVPRKNQIIVIDMAIKMIAPAASPGLLSRARRALLLLKQASEDPCSS